MKWSAKLGEFAGDSCLHPCHILNRNCVGSLCALAGEAQRRGRVDGVMGVPVGCGGVGAGFKGGQRHSGGFSFRH